MLFQEKGVYKACVHFNEVAVHSPEAEIAARKKKASKKKSEVLPEEK